MTKPPAGVKSAKAELAARDIVKTIEGWNADISARDRRGKYARMAESPFVFYRGTNHLFWADFATDERLKRFGDERTKTWLKGDMHAENFGAFCNNEGKVVYDFNDFDDSIIADYQFDVWRMAVSLVLVVRQNATPLANDTGYLRAFARAYLDAVAAYVDNANAVSRQFTKVNTVKPLRKFLEKVERKQGAKIMLSKWTQLTDDRRHFLNSDKLAPVARKERDAIVNAIPGYGKTLGGALKYDPGYFEVLDIAKRLQAGTGSLGVRRYYILIEGKTKDASDKEILDVKEQQKPTPYFFLSEAEKADYERNFSNDGERHAHALRALTSIRNAYGDTVFVDDYLGWMEFLDGCFSVRRRSPYKKTYPTSKLDKKKRLVQMSEQWAEILATGHCRAYYFDDTLLPGPLAGPVAELTEGRCTEFEDLVIEIALGYADQVQQDWEAFAASRER